MRKTLTLISLLAVVMLLMGACSTSVTTTTPAATVAATTAAAGSTSAAVPSAPPDGGGGAPPGDGGASSVEEGLATATGAYTVDGTNETQTDQTYTATNEDQSAIYVINGGTLTLNNPTITTSGNTSSDSNSSFYGLNAGVLATAGSTINIVGGRIETTGTGANGAFATGSGATVNLSQVTITATGDGGHGVMATQGGVLTLTDVVMNTAGAHSAPIATDRGSGTITATGGEVTTTGQDSPCYYSTGLLTISNHTCNATGSEVAVIEGANSIILTDVTASSSVADKWGVMIYQSMSGDAEGADGIFTMSGGSLAYTASGPLFYVTNTTAHINLKGVAVNAASGTLVRAEGTERWGTSGANGGTVILIADAQTLTGDMTADAISALNVTLQNGSALTGALNADQTAKEVVLTLDATSTWNVTADSYLTCLTDPDGISGTTISNITGNGHTVYYDSNACSALGGQTYTLNGGGNLVPMNH